MITSLSWVSDRKGYRYQRGDPLTGRAWPVMPKSFADLARSAAATAGYLGFQPNACLVNRYGPGTRLALHQDKDESDFIAPIVSVSLGLPARFLFGGLQQAIAPENMHVVEGVVTFGRGYAAASLHLVAVQVRVVEARQAHWQVEVMPGRLHSLLYRDGDESTPLPAGGLLEGRRVLDEDPAAHGAPIEWPTVNRRRPAPTSGCS